MAILSLFMYNCHDKWILVVGPQQATSPAGRQVFIEVQTSSWCLVDRSSGGNTGIGCCLYFPIVEWLTQDWEGGTGWQRGHCFYSGIDMELQRKEFIDNHGLTIATLTARAVEVDQPTRKTDQTNAGLYAVRSSMPTGASKEPLPFFMGPLFKAREFDPL